MKTLIRILALFLLLTSSASSENVQFRYPIKSHPDYPDYVTRYFNLDTSGEDWNCGFLGNGEDSGTDFGVNTIIGLRTIVAAADGKVVKATNTYPDSCYTDELPISQQRACVGNDNFGNAVRIRHSDGTVSIYGHLEKGSVLVNEGDDVKCGQEIGKGGDSGVSNGAHLHFEVWLHGSDDYKIDPFKSSREECGSGNNVSYWVVQGEYNSQGSDMPGKVPSDVCFGVFEPNNKYSYATDIEVSDSLQANFYQQHLLQKPGDQDFLKFSLDGTRRIGIDTVGLSNGISITLRNNDLFQVLETAVTSASLSKFLEFDTTLDAGTYYIGINDPQVSIQENFPYSIGIFEIGSCPNISSQYSYKDVGSNLNCELELSPPSLVSPPAVTSTTTPTLRWNSVYGATEYQIYVYKKDGGSFDRVLPRIDTADTSYIIQAGKLERGESYRASL